MIEQNQNGGFEIKNANNVLKGDFSNPFVKKLTKEVLDKIDVNKIEIFFTGGFVEDSFSSAIMCGVISSVVKSLYGYLSLKYEDVGLYEDINPTYNESNLELSLSGSISVSLIKLFLAIAGANKRLKGEMINEGKL